MRNKDEHALFFTRKRGLMEWKDENVGRRVCSWVDRVKCVVQQKTAAFHAWLAFQLESADGVGEMAFKFNALFL